MCEAISMATTKATMKDFDSILIESIDGTISSVLGRKIMKATYGYMAKDCGISKEHIPDRLDEFDAALMRIFGVGGLTLSRAIAKRLCAQLGLQFVPVANKRLADYVNEAKEKLK